MFSWVQQFPPAEAKSSGRREEPKKGWNCFSLIQNWKLLKYGGSLGENCFLEQWPLPEAACHRLLQASPCGLYLFIVLLFSSPCFVPILTVLKVTTWAVPPHRCLISALSSPSSLQARALCCFSPALLSVAATERRFDLVEWREDFAANSLASEVVLNRIDWPGYFLILEVSGWLLRTGFLCSVDRVVARISGTFLILRTTEVWNNFPGKVTESLSSWGV